MYGNNQTYCWYIIYIFHLILSPQQRVGIVLVTGKIGLERKLDSPTGILRLITQVSSVSSSTTMNIGLHNSRSQAGIYWRITSNWDYVHCTSLLV
jgi:hypothetical protein